MRSTASFDATAMGKVLLEKAESSNRELQVKRDATLALADCEKQFDLMSTSFEKYCSGQEDEDLPAKIFKLQEACSTFASVCKSPELPESAKTSAQKRCVDLLAPLLEACVKQTVAFLENALTCLHLGCQHNPEQSLASKVRGHAKFDETEEAG